MASESNAARSKPPRRPARFVAALLIVGTVAVIAVNYGWLYESLLLERFEVPWKPPADYWNPESYGGSTWPNYEETTGRREYHTHRWTGRKHGRETFFWQNTNVKSLERRVDGDEVVGVTTAWNEDGNVIWQSRPTEDGEELRQAPPWWDGVADQVVTTDPDAGMDDVVQPHGVFRAYYGDTTVLRWETSYDRGAAARVWTSWRADGRIDRQVLYTGEDEPRTRIEPPWWGDAEDQVLEGRIVYVGNGLSLLSDLIGADDASSVSFFFWDLAGLVVAEFVDGDLHGPFAIYVDGHRVYVGEVSQGEPIGVHTAWRLDGFRRYPFRDRDQERWGEVTPVIAWQRVYGAAETVTVEEDWRPPIDGPVRVDYHEDRVFGDGGPRRVRPPLRQRGAEPPAWFFGWDSPVDVAKGRLVGGRRQGVWTYEELGVDASLEVQYQRRYERGRLVDQRASAPWWEK